MSTQKSVGYTRGMQPTPNVSLREHSTMRLGGTAAFAVDVRDRNEVVQALQWAADRQLPVMMIGAGSNIVWRDEGYPGLLLVNHIRRFEDFDEDGLNHYVTIGAGENWDSVVARTAAAGLTGIEALSLVPGTAGATPVQNVGAYGQEIADSLVTVEAYDVTTQRFVNLRAEECGFGYRMSRFKAADRGRFFITALTLHLMRRNPEPPFYGAVEQYLATHHITDFTPQIVRDAVIAIRSHKLPDPAQVANNGSFFANPIIDEAMYVQRFAAIDEVPHWAAGEGKVKLSAAWLIAQAGFQDCHDPDTGMATWPAQPLVFVNEHAHATADLLRFKQKIVDAVHRQFGITLQQEPELLP